jgi:polar amino acid transport system substrate-binding protein
MQVDTINNQEVLHRCWLLQDFGEGGNAIIYHYEDFYTYLDISEVHLWTAENDTQLVQLAFSGNHVGERMGYGAEADRHDPPQNFLMWMEISILDNQIDINPPSHNEITWSVTSETDSFEIVAASYNELPLPDDATSMGLFDENAWYSGLPREFILPVWEGQYWMLTNYLGGGWNEIPAERRPVYETNFDISEAIAFYLDELGHRGWNLKNNYLIFGLPEHYLFFERNGVVMPVIFAPDASGITTISAILPPPDIVVEAVLSGWISFKTQNYYEYGDRITAIAFDTQEKIWIGSGIGLKIYDGEMWANYNAADLNLPLEGEDFDVLALAVDQRGKVWVGSHEGLSVFDGQTWNTYTPENSELGSTPWAITVDGTGKIWLGHGYSSSVSMFDGKTFKNYNENDIGMPGGHAVNVITTDQKGCVWIGTSGGGVYTFDGKSWKMVVDAKTSAGHTDIMISIEDLAIDHQGRVWVGSGQGLSMFDGNKWATYTTENSDLPDNWVNSLEVDPNGNIWVITTGGRLSRIDNSGMWTDYTPLNPDISIKSPETLAIDPLGRVWVGMDYGGISVYTPSGTTPINTAPPVPTPTPTPTSTPRAPYKIRGGECLGSAEDALIDLDCREIAIAVENANLPFNFVLNETNEPGGWDYDAWEEICTRLHCTPVYVESPWEGMVDAVAAGKFDAAAGGITYWQYREELVDYSEGYISIDQRLLVRADETRIAEIEDIINDRNLKLGALTGTTNYVVAYDNLSSHDRIEGFENTTSSIHALISGEIDALIVNDLAGVGYVGEDENGLVHLGENKDKVKLVGRSLYNDWLGFIYPKGSDLAGPVNLALQSMMADGFLEALNKRYFGPEFTITYDDIGLGAYGE